MKATIIDSKNVHATSNAPRETRCIACDKPVLHRNAADSYAWRHAEKALAIQVGCRKLVARLVRAATEDTRASSVKRRVRGLAALAFAPQVHLALQSYGLDPEVNVAWLLKQLPGEAKGSLKIIITNDAKLLLRHCQQEPGLVFDVRPGCNGHEEELLNLPGYVPLVEAVSLTLFPHVIRAAERFNSPVLYVLGDEAAWRATLERVYAAASDQEWVIRQASRLLTADSTN
jgi:hypothetical protein